MRAPILLSALLFALALPMAARAEIEQGYCVVEPAADDEETLAYTQGLFETNGVSRAFAAKVFERQTRLAYPEAKGSARCVFGRDEYDLKDAWKADISRMRSAGRKVVRY